MGDLRARQRVPAQVGDRLELENWDGHKTLVQQSSITGRVIAPILA